MTLVKAIGLDATRNVSSVYFEILVSLPGHYPSRHRQEDLHAIQNVRICSFWDSHCEFVQSAESILGCNIEKRRNSHADHACIGCWIAIT